LKTKTFLFVLLLTLAIQATPLKDPTNSADILVIAHPDQAETMEIYKDWREAQGFIVKIVTTNAVYDEFESLQKFNSINNFADYAITTWEHPPSYLLLIGGYGSVPSFPIDYTIGGETETVLVDNYYVIDESVTPCQLRIPIGRIPTETTQQLLNILEKTMYVENQHYRNLYGADFLFLADNVQFETYNEIFEERTTDLVEKLPDDQLWRRIDVDSASIYFGTRQDFLDELNLNPLVVNFYGHANEKLWTHEKILTYQDIDSVNNINAPFLMLPFASEALVSETPDSVLINHFLWAKNKGAFGAIASGGLQFIPDLDTLAYHIYEELFKQQPARMGDILLSSLNNLEPRYSDRYFLFSFTVIGDPCLSLPFRTQASVDDQRISQPLAFELKQNYPNPFNPKTTIKFSLPKEENIDLIIYNILGQPVARVLEHQRMASGSHSVIFDASKLKSGTLIYSLKAGAFQQTRRMVLLK
jgi:hypothetical protein